MRILLLGDASHYHATLAEGLRPRGHEVTVASAGSAWMDTPRDIDLSRHPGKLGGALLWLRLSTALRSRLKGFDVVQLASPVFVELRPERVAALLRRLKADNGAVMLTALATDRAFIDMCLAEDSPMPYSEWSRPALQPLIDSWRAPEVSALCREVYATVDGCATALWEYDEAMRRVMDPAKIVYTGIPIDRTAITPHAEHSGPVNIFLGRHSRRMDVKGTDIMERAARRAVEASAGALRLEIVEDRPYAEYVQLMNRADVVLDQLYSPTPATNALLAMGAGKVAVSGGEEPFYRFIGEKELRPVVNIDPRTDAEEQLTTALLRLRDPELRRRLGREGREFVERHNDVDVVARRFEQLWTGRAERI